MKVRDELLEVKRRDDRAVDAGGGDVDRRQFFLRGGDEKDWDVRPWVVGRAAVGVASETADDLDRVEVAEGGIDQGQVESAQAKDLEGLDAAGDRARPESAVNESLRQERTQVGVVGDDQNVRSRERRVSGGHGPIPRRVPTQSRRAS